MSMSSSHTIYIPVVLHGYSTVYWTRPQPHFEGERVKHGFFPKLLVLVTVAIQITGMMRAALGVYRPLLTMLLLAEVFLSLNKWQLLTIWLLYITLQLFLQPYNRNLNNLLLRRAAETLQGSVYHLDSPLEILCTTVLARVHWTPCSSPDPPSPQGPACYSASPFCLKKK